MTSARWAPVIVLGFALVSLGGPPAHANYYELYGFTPRSTAMGGAMTAAVRDYAATFYNPAALTVAKEGHVGLIGYIRVPDFFVERQATVLSDEHPTVLPEMGGGVGLGWAYPMGGIFEDRLALGVSLHLPAGRLVRVQGGDRLSPQYYMYQNLHDKLMLLAAVAFEPFEWLSIGGGIQVLADLAGGAELNLDIIDGRFTKREFSVDIRPTASPNVGLHLRPLPGMAVGLTWRGTSAVRFSVPVSLSEGESLSMLLDVSQTVQFTPHQIALGLSYTVPSIAFTLATDVTLSLWSFAPDPSPQLRVDIGGPLLASLGLSEALDVSVDTEPLQMGFSDTVTVRFGVEWAGLSWLGLRAGYTFRPTPVPKQTGPSVYLDSDAHVLSIGSGFTFFDPLGVHAHPLTVDLAAQVVILPPRTVERTAPSDPVGNLRYGGQIWSFSLSVSHAY